MSLKKYILLFVVTFLTALFSFSQTEEEMKQQADNFFKNKQYIEATPLYLRLLSLQPKSHDYCYKYGACLLYNSNNKQEAIRYLNYAITSPSPAPETFYFLGKAFHLNYQFNDAILEYKKYIKVAGEKGEFVPEANRNIAMCENGKNLLTTLTDIIVKKKTEIKEEDFFRLYDLTKIGGSIIIAIDFQTKTDKKNNHKPVVHISPDMENVYFSSYGDGDNLDIYVARRLPGGKFGTPQKINGGVNTPFDEDYPYMHPNGKELYFSSKGHNSMGGYDVFKAKFDADNNAFTDVQNIDFAISSPDDDILYVADKEYKNAYFSSKRQSQDGKIVVYQVAVERIPIQLAIVKGTFQSSILPNNPKMTVEVVDKTNGKKIGVFNTLKESSYLITFPKGGKYTYNITIEGSSEAFNADVEIPFLKELRPLKQVITHELADGKEIIRITNLFDERFEDAQSIIAQVLREKANLNVNTDQYSEEDLKNQGKINDVLAELNLQKLSIPEVGQLLERKEKELSEADGNQIQNASNGLTLELYNEIKTIDSEIKKLVQEADNSETSKRKEIVLTNAKDLFEQREEKIELIKTYQEQGKSASSNSTNHTTDAGKLSQISDQYNELLAQDNEAKIVDLLLENKDYLKSVLTSNQLPYEELIDEQNKIDAEIQKLKKIEEVNQGEVNRTSNEIADLQRQKDEAKEKLKQGIQDEIDAKNYQLEDNKSALNKVQKLISEQEVKRTEVTEQLNTLHQLENYNGNKVSDEELAQAKAAINDDKIRTLKSYVENSLKEVSTIATTETPTNESKTIEEYNAKSEEILNNTALSDYEKQEQLVALNETKKQEVRHLITSIETNSQLNETEKDKQKLAASKILQQLKQDESI